MRRSIQFETVDSVEMLEKRLSLSALAAAMISSMAAAVPRAGDGDDPLPDPEPDPPPYPGDDPPIEYPVLPPSGPIGPGLVS
jgi:hypothetical protein